MDIRAKINRFIDEKSVLEKDAFLLQKLGRVHLLNELSKNMLERYRRLGRLVF